MIGVAANEAELETVEEFFELFKTPWEPVVPGRKYRVVLATTECGQHLDTQLLLLYGSSTRAADRETGTAVEQLGGPVDVEWEGLAFPVYGGTAAFVGRNIEGALTSGARRLDYRRRAEGRDIWRVGYDLFAEVGRLLTDGQPPANAPTPTLEMHIGFLRHVLLQSGVSFIEVPPHPAGYAFTCCLTHDVDFFGIRNHVFDRTFAGFALRASIGTLADVARGRRPASDALRNWGALAKTPLVYAGLAEDFWHPVKDYARADGGRPSTYFVVPFKGRPGAAPGGRPDATRAVKYQLGQVASELAPAAGGDREVAVHGIDAWCDAQAGSEELEQITTVTGRCTAGVRMHWLYYDRESPRRLEQAGFDYDSTWGYNEAVGYRAGTSQVFRLPGTERLLELPMSIMDSALFFPGRMGLSLEEALQACGRVVSHAQRFGGTVVVNWHDRSVAPERLWGRAYRALLDLISAHRAWFATAEDTVRWFRWRRSICFARGERAEGVVDVAAASIASPAGLIRRYRPVARAVEIDEEPFDGGVTARLGFPPSITSASTHG